MRPQPAAPQIAIPQAAARSAPGRRWRLAVALLLAGAAVAAWLFWPRDVAHPPREATSQLPARPALAVLPLDNLSEGELGQGLAFSGKVDAAREFARALEAAELTDAWALAEVYCAGSTCRNP